MTDQHPEELLAAYVDGELDDAERRAVEAHLAACARCREDVELARASVARLRALPELEAPAGAASRALAEASGGGRAAAAAARPPRWARWIPAAAAAVLVAVVAVVALKPSGGSSEASNRNLFTPAEGGAAAIAPSATAVPVPAPNADAQRALNAALTSGVRLEPLDLDYTSDEIRKLTDESADRYRGAQVPKAKGTASFSAADSTPVQGTVAKSALACVESQVAPTATDALVRLIQARYEDAPAYVAVFVHAPAPGKTANEVLVWVVRQNGCTIANFAYRRL